MKFETSRYIPSKSNAPQPLMIYLGIILVGRTVGAIVTYLRIQYGGASSSVGQLWINTDVPGAIPTDFKTDKFSFGLHFFSDFLEPYLKSYFRIPYYNAPTKGFGVSNYPPLGQAIFLPFRIFPYRVGVILYLLIIVVLAAIPTWLLLGRLQFAQRIFLLIFGVVLTYPLLFSLDRGNYTGFALSLLLFAALSYSRGNYRKFGVFIALAACLKLTPVFFLIVLAKKRKWTDLSIAIGTGITVSAFSMLLFKGSFNQNWIAFFKILGKFHGNLNVDGKWRTANNSLMALFQDMGDSNWSMLHSFGEFLQHNFIFFVSLMMTLLLASIFFSSNSERSLLFAITGLTVMTNLSLPVIFTYGLMFYLLPLLIIIGTGYREKVDYFLVSLIGLLFIDKTPYTPVHAIISGGNLLNPLLQLLIFSACIKVISRDRFGSDVSIVKR